MSDEEPKHKNHSAVKTHTGTFYKPETKGKKKAGLLDWSLDELIQYKHNGTPPQRIPDAHLLYLLGKSGVSATNACALFDISSDKFYKNPDWCENWAKGRAEIGSTIRASIVEDALEKDNLMAKIYLDKLIGGDKVGENTLVQVNVSTNGNLAQVSTDELLSVAFNDIDDKNTPDN